MVSLFLVRGCLCLPKLCALKVMLHKRLEEYQESVWEHALGHSGQPSVDLSMQLYKTELGLGGCRLFKSEFKIPKKTHLFYFTSQFIRLLNGPILTQLLSPTFLIELPAAGIRPHHLGGLLVWGCCLPTTIARKPGMKSVTVPIVPDAQVEVYGKYHSRSCWGRGRRRDTHLDVAAVGVSLAVS